MNDLKPCPFCDSETQVAIDIHGFGKYSVRCFECGARTKQVLGYEKAIENWNMRVEGSEKSAEWVEAGEGITRRVICSNCRKEKNGLGYTKYCSECGAKTRGCAM